MTFYCISHNAQDRSFLFLRDAVEKRSDLSFEWIDPFRHSRQSLPKTTPGDMLYRVSIKRLAVNMEQAMYRPGVSTVVTSVEHRVLSYSAYNEQRLLFSEWGISAPRTIGWIAEDVEQLLKDIDWLGGFPLIIKIPGGSHGVGVMKVDSLDSLLSVRDVLRGQKLAGILQQFIPVRRSARLIVLEDRVVDSIEYTAPEGDFRSNVGKKPSVAPKVFPEAIQDLAIRATNKVQRSFGGVDILIDDDGRGYVAEVNTPCFFARAQMETGTDIAGLLVDHLVKKATEQASS